MGLSGRAQWVHLPAVLAGEFGIARSVGRMHIAQGRVKLNGQVVTDIDVDLGAIPDGDPVSIELERAEPRDTILRILEWGA